MDFKKRKEVLYYTSFDSCYQNLHDVPDSNKTWKKYYFFVKGGLENFKDSKLDSGIIRTTPDTLGEEALTRSVLNKTQRGDLKKLLKPDYCPLKVILTQVTLSSTSLITDPPMDFKRRVVSGFRSKVRKRKTIEQTTDGLSKRRVLINEFSSEQTIFDQGVQVGIPEADKSLLDNAKVLHITTALRTTKYESNDLEAQIQLQLMDATKAASRIDNLQKDFEVSSTELAKANSITKDLKKDLVASQRIFEVREKEKGLLQSELEQVKKELENSHSEVEIARQSLAEIKRKAATEVELIKIEAR
ncbi:hypothetical protein F0562_003748 [Nyssa sinensis]|uniref:Uncharacterized protein n=1 Tax=Nyssa sinensis TaxID=561372 RepID=A0A5J5BWZ1_9ASTE|nr:hypothetical protein F0562_003748 [Nyssa sinensis]